MNLLPGVKADAIFSTCRTYRYMLTRTWPGPGPLGVFVLLNPSTANAEADDRTLRKVQAFAQRWGWRGLVVLNLFALRSTDPRALYEHPDPVGPRNSRFLERVPAVVEGPTVLGWGTHGAEVMQGLQVQHALGLLPEELWCLRRTADGQPGHPLYLRGDTALVRFR